MKKLYEKSRLGFALLWIGLYCVLMSVGDSLSQVVGVEKAVTLPIAILLSAVLVLFIKKNGVDRKYGLCKSVVPVSKLIFYLPLLLLLTVNLWHGFALNLSVIEIVLYILTMLFVGLLEEVIFRGLLFEAMRKDSLKAAIIVSSLTFGMGHIINLFNGSGAELFSNLMQIIYASASGFMLVAMYLKTESLVAPITFHGIFNALSVFSDEGALTDTDRIISCVFITVISVLYGVYLMKSGKGETNDNKTCE